MYLAYFILSKNKKKGIFSGIYNLSIFVFFGKSRLSYGYFLCLLIKMHAF